MAEHDILCISSIDWDFLWQTHQELMSTLAARGHRVLFIENTGVRPVRLRDVSRLRHRIHNWWKGTGGFREEQPKLFVLSPIVVPLPYSRIARVINRALLVRSIRRWMGATGAARPVIWTFLPTPLAHALIGDLDPTLTIYYCVDDFASSSPEAKRVESSEIAMFRGADLVFVTSDKLRARAARYSERVHLFPAGVAYEIFDRIRQSVRQPPGDIASLKRPIVGYVGGLHQWIDQELVAETAARLPDVTFVFVGPVQCDLSRLEACPNVVLIGQKGHEELPRYVREFDVGIVPYRSSEYTANVYPGKLNEYLAMGIPVVASDLPEIRRFNAVHGEMVAIASDPDGLAAAIRAATSGGAPSSPARRIEVAAENSWRSRIDAMSALIEVAAEDRAAREERWDARLRRTYRSARRRMLEAVVAVALAYGVLFQTPLIWAIASPLRLSQAPVPADAIVVFAGGVGESGQAGGGYQERVRQAVDLYRSGLAPTIVYSSGFVFAFQEPEVMKTLSISSGVPASAILLETRAANTHENVVFSSDIARARGWHRVLLVSSPYNMRRALLTWRKAAPDIDVVPTPVPVSQFYQHRYGASLVQIRGIAQEYAALVLYWFRGWV